MVSEAQRRATDRYLKAHTVQKCMRINRETEKGLLAWVESRDEPFATYVKRLIREDMERHGEGV